VADEHDLQEVPFADGDDGGDRLQESVFLDSMAGLGGAGGVGSIASFAADWYDRRRDHVGERAAIAAEYEAQLRALDAERRALYAQLHGLAALDALDGFGPQDDFDGFGPEPGYFGGFDCE
jgi:hypothetical protein